MVVGDAGRVASTLGKPDLVHHALGSRPFSVWLGDQQERAAFAHDDRIAALVETRGDGPRDAEEAAALLRAYATQGMAVTESLVGRICAVLRDAATDTVLCLRDPLGVDPLFYAERPGSLVVSPSPELLARSAEAAPSPDRLALAEWVTTSTTPMARTLYEGVTRIPPGHALAASPTTVRVFRYWAPPVAEISERVGDDEALDRFDAAFDRAIADAAGNQRAAVFFSGGLDSSLVAAALARHHAVQGLDPPLALTLKFPRPEADEERPARAVAAALGLPHLVVPLGDALGGAGLLSSGIEACTRLWCPVGNPWRAAYDHLAVEARREGCRVAMAGDGGNDLLESPWELAGDLIRRGRLGRLLRFAYAQRSYYGGRRRDVLRRVAWERGLAALARPAIHAALLAASPDRVARVRERRADATIPTWALPDPELRAEVVRYRSSLSPPLSYRDLHGFARGRLLDSAFLAIVHESTRLSSRHLGIELVSPYWDADLVELVFALPARSFQIGGHAKGLARTSLARRLDADVARRLRPIRADTTLAAALAREAGPLIATLGGFRRLSALGVVSESAATDFVDPRDAPPTPDLLRWRLLCTEAWLQARSL